MVSFYISSQHAFVFEGERLMRESAAHMLTRTSTFLERAENTLSVTLALKQDDVLRTNASIERYFFEQLKANPSVSGLFYGNPKGDFIFVSRSTSVEGADFRTKIISRSQGISGAALTFRGDDFRAVSSRFDSEDRYDPRVRSWYKLAIEQGMAVWTPPYVFFTSRQPGITLGAPVFADNGTVKGVLGLDIQLSDLSGFLAGQELAQVGSIMIVEQNGKIIAHPDPNMMVMANRDAPDDLEIMKVEEGNDPAAAAAARLAPGAASAFEVDGQNHLGMNRRLSIRNLDWRIVLTVPAEHFLATSYEHRDRHLAIAVLLAAGALFIGSLIAGTITRPLLALSREARLLAQNGDVELVKSSSSYREVEMVRHAFRSFVSRQTADTAALTSLNGDLTQSKMELEQRVNQRTAELVLETDGHRRTGRELERALHEARGANEAKSRFIASMSHELRTPLNAIIGFGEILDNELGDKPGIKTIGGAAHEYPAYIVASGRRLLTLLNDVLDQAQYDAVGLQIDLRPTDPKDIFQASIVETSIIAREYDVEVIDLTAPAARLPVADQKRLQQVMINLVSNAIKYNRPGGQVVLRTMERGDALRLMVSDTGYGIAKEYWPAVFQRFNRLGQEGSAIPGTGIGLSLSKDMIEEMGGVIGFESEEGVGSTFWVELPLDVGAQMGSINVL